MPVNILLKIMTSEDISECMANDALKDKEFRENLEMSMMTPEEQSDAFVRLLGGG